MDEHESEVWEEIPLQPDEQEWFDYHSEEIVAAWHAVRDKIAELGVYVLDRCTIGDFVTFCYEHSSGRLPPV